MHLKIRMVQVLVWQLKCYCTLSPRQTLEPILITHKRENQKLDTSSGIVKPRKHKVSILFVNCLPFHKDHWLLIRHPHQSQMQFPVTHCAMYVSQICCVYPTDWKKHYSNDLLHSVLVLLISAAMLGLYIGTKLPFMNELMEGFNL